ncbi:MAG: hypothetical protein IPK60_17765 [Sandaracinaceae bacterium]|nr:hypothetical protein [Sandaracinaceae bacterium]
MTVRDLGYRAYDGVRLPASRNTYVLLGHAMRRAWGSWLVKIAVFLGWIPLVVYLIKVMFVYWLMSKLEGGRPPPGEAADALGILTDPGESIRNLFNYQVWAFVTLITLGAGSGTIAEDFTHKAFQFYFAKPVTATQYLLARTGATAIFSFMLTFIPALILVLGIVVAADPSLRLQHFGLVLPALFYSLLISSVLSVMAVATSSISKSRALTMSAWIVLLIVPQSIASLVSAIGNVSWFYLASPPALLGLVGDALFKTVDTEHLVRWYHAAPLLIALTAGSIWLANRRVRNAEVIT